MERKLFFLIVVLSIPVMILAVIEDGTIFVWNRTETDPSALNTFKMKSIPREQSKVDNPEKLATQGTQDEEKQNKMKGQVVPSSYKTSAMLITQSKRVGHHGHYAIANKNNINKR